MVTVLRIEELGMSGLSIFLFLQTIFSWWWFPALILLPDIAMAGYLVNPKTGSVIYNLFHHKVIAVLTYVLGYIWGLPILELTGIIIFGHASLDRIFGYGLKGTSNNSLWLRTRSFCSLTRRGERYMAGPI